MPSPISRTRTVAAAAVCVIAAMHIAHAAPDDAAPATAKLTMAPLSAPQAVLCKPDAGAVRLVGDVVYTGAPIQIDSRNGAQTTLAGEQVKFTLAAGQGIKLVHNRRSVALQQDQTGFKPVKLRLAEERPYILAFPYGFVMDQLGGLIAAGEPEPAPQGSLLLRSGAGQYFSLDGQSFCLFDANTDGYYKLGDDAIGMGRSGTPFSVFAPLGRLLATPKGVYQINALAEDGSELKYSRYDGPAGALVVAADQTDLQLGAAFSSSEAGLNFAVPVESAHPAELKAAPGKYNLMYGLAFSPKLKKLVATVAQGKLPPADLAANQSQTIAVGGPFALEFELQTVGRQMTITSSTIHLWGKHGEEYANFKWAEEPQVSLVAGGKTTVLGKMEFG